VRGRPSVQEFPVRLRFIALLASLLACAPLLSACEDGNLLGTLILSSDTTAIGLPGGSAEGSAIDIVRSGGDFDLVRNPERLTDAEQWDFALRSTPAGLVFRPFTPVASQFRGAGIAVSDRPFADLKRAPRGTASYSSEPVSVRLGGVYLLRSRQFASGNTTCVKYAKFRVLEINQATSIVRFEVVINEGCDDERLADD
jgi:hypothetical protein